MEKDIESACTRRWECIHYSVTHFLLDRNVQNEKRDEEDGRTHGLSCEVCRKWFRMSLKGGFCASWRDLGSCGPYLK